MRKQESAVLGIRMPLAKFAAVRQRAALEGKTLSQIGGEMVDAAMDGWNPEVAGLIENANRYAQCDCGAEVDTETFGECHACGRTVAA